MLRKRDAESETGAHDRDDAATQRPSPPQEPPKQLALPLHIPKNRSTGNLALNVHTSDKARFRLSYDAGAAAAEYDALARSPLMTDHDHGLGLSGLRRIRQHTPIRAPTMPSDSSSPASGMAGSTASASFASAGSVASASLPRSSSMSTMTYYGRTATAAAAAALPTSSLSSLSSVSSSPSFIEDLSRFPSESLHSFSFAHQSEELLHNRQNVLKRSVDFLKDRMGWNASAAAGFLSGPLSGPPATSSENVFEKHFIPRTTSPEQLSAAGVSPMSMPYRASDLSLTDTPLHTSPILEGIESRPGEPITRLSTNDLPSLIALSGLDSHSGAASDVPAAHLLANSPDSSRTPTNESGTTQQTSPPTSRRPSPLLTRSMTDVTAHQKRHDYDSQGASSPGLAAFSPATLAVPGSDVRHHEITAGPPSMLQQSLASPAASLPGNLANLGNAAHHPYGTRWVPAAQAIFTTEAKPPWTIMAANDLACLVFGVTRAEVRKMGILEVVQEERRAWLEKKLLHAHADDDDDNDWEAEAAAAAAPLPASSPKPATINTSHLLGARSGGITAKLLSKPNSRSQTPQGSRRQSNASQPSQPLQKLQKLQKSSSSSQSSQPFQHPPRRATTAHSGDGTATKPNRGAGYHHNHKKSRGVLLCGDVVPIQKRNGATGSASLWVKEKRVGLIWVLEEIHEDVATIVLDEDGYVKTLTGALGPIWGDDTLEPGMDIGSLIPRIPRQGIDAWAGPVDFAEVSRRKYYTCRNQDQINIPASIERIPGQLALRVSSFPHIAGIIVVSTQTLAIKSSNSVFCSALFGYEKPNGLPINQLLPDFDKVLQILVDVDNVHLVDGIIVPEQSFRKAAAFLALREGRPDATTTFLRPDGLPARHRDGSQLKLDVQMRVVKSEKQTKIREETVLEASEEDDSSTAPSSATSASGTYTVTQSEMVYALWITYSRHLHATRSNLGGIASPLLSGTATPLHQPSPGQTPVHSPVEMSPQPVNRQLQIPNIMERTPAAQTLTRQLRDVALNAATKITGGRKRTQTGNSTITIKQKSTVIPGQQQQSAPGPETKFEDVPPPAGRTAAGAAFKMAESTRSIEKVSAASTPFAAGGISPTAAAASIPADTASSVAATATIAGTAASSFPNSASEKKTIDSFAILEDMGQGAYGQVKLAQYKTTGKKVVLKYVTKRRILVDTWTRDRRLGTVPLEIHVLDYLRRDGLRHPNIVEMEDFFEDDVNYYIEMVPHGLPGMDLFDYIELRANMEESECRSIFVQVARAIHHLHIKALVVHRDIKDENVILDGEGNIKLIDFGSAAYIKSGPFDVFVGTIDYAAPEVLEGRPYGGKEQDVWALGILLYTIIYKENPFYSIDEIMDRDLRVPYTISDDSIDLIRHMLDRNVQQRYTISQVLDHPWCQMEQ